jgi:hypothetical protein
MDLQAVSLSELEGVEGGGWFGLDRHPFPPIEPPCRPDPNNAGQCRPDPPDAGSSDRDAGPRDVE